MSFYRLARLAASRGSAHYPAAMPVMVIGAETALGETVVRRLLRTGGQVRVFIDPEHDDLIDDYRAVGVKVARGTVDDVGLLELALAQVHTVIHATDSLLDPPGEVLDGIASVAEAALGANVRRIVWPSWLGAEAPGGDEWLEMCAQAEALLGDLPLETVVVRRALTYGLGDAFTTALAAAGAPDGGASTAPLWVGDLAETLVAADAQRGEDEVMRLVVELAGPDVFGLREFAGALGDAVGRMRGVTLPSHAIGYLSADRLPGPGALGATGTRVAEALPLLREG